MENKKVMYPYLILLTIVAAFMMVMFHHNIELEQWIYVLFWIMLGIISESFLIMLPSGIGTSVAGAVYLYIGIMSNPLMAMCVAMISMAMRFPEVNGHREHLFNTKHYVLWFNVINVGITYGLSTYAFQFAPKEFNLLAVMGLTVIAVLIAEAANFVTLSTMLKICAKVSYKDTFLSIFDTIANTFAVSMLGVFLAFAHNQYGMETVILFFIPLLLARYSFKLYFESQSMALDTIHALNEALHAKDAYTGGHTGRVQQYAIDLGTAYGLSAKNIEIIKTASLLHDIGKIGIPDDILNKPGKLLEDEYEQIKEHSSIGAKILSNVDSLKKVSKIIVQHHERYDGTGYPGRLAGDEIMLEAAILMIADSFDAMTTDRPYRKALSIYEAKTELEKNSGTQFHPELVNCFIKKVLEGKSEDYIKTSTRGVYDF